MLLQIQLQAPVRTTRLGDDRDSSDTELFPKSRHGSAFDLLGQQGYDDDHDGGSPPASLQFGEERGTADSGVDEG